MCRVSDNDLGIDRHRDENQTCKRRCAAAHHGKKAIPLLRHKRFSLSSESRMGLSPERRVAYIWAPRDVWVPQVPPWDLGTIAHPSDSLKQGFPIAAIPALDSFQLLFVVLVDAIRACFMLDDRFQRYFLQGLS